jgi:hypothetical protein
VCIQEKARDKTCEYAGFGCVGQLLGNDANGQPAFDFQNTLAVAATTLNETGSCSALDGFVDGVCDVSNRCCPNCNSEMAGLTDCLVNDFVLPLFVMDPAANCEIVTGASGTCEIGATALVTRSANLDKTSTIDTTSTTTTTSNVLDGVDVSECEEGMAFDFIVHNQTYAVDQFMGCIGKKMGEVYAQVESEDGTQPEGTSSANSVFGTFALATSMLLVVAVSAVGMQ